MRIVQFAAALVLTPLCLAQSPVVAPKPSTDAPVQQGTDDQRKPKTDKQKQQPKPTSKPSKDKQKPKPGTGAKPATEPAKPLDTLVGVEDKSADELPKGLDPADIAAMKSAQQMLAAEKRLKEMLKRGEFKDIDRILTFEELESWPYEEGLKGMPKAVRKLDGEKVMMTGFMLPIDEVEGIKEFLLVQSLWSCCYGQPPDINGIVRVVMKGKARLDYQFDPIKIVGDFKVEAAYEDGYCLDIYQLHADSVEAIKLK